ncbi:acyl-CoA dehydrogenase family protein [Limobrevibacterium gyesilva]|uniref:Acyl-CoA dehydrogenase family protein n=1 Tax=Limobrevibacterium gyesilva TaxID=2991712 RepID=A0AA41YI25_9PROT|nr:acyl-CoA dehydrogenase family protein [Limobrevibacterium gyesilva]MCW3473879.1 acyl-CoA dehydrogenase family protein [Limobrevibacterium gyesilva]
MSDTSFLDWPFLDDTHRAFARRLEAWAAEHIGTDVHPHTDVDGECRTLVRKLGEGGWLAAAVPEQGEQALDVRTLCLTREILARHSGLADFVFAMQGLGTGSVTLFGTPEMRARILPPVRAGERIAAFALSEPDAGSDVAALSTTATRVAGGWRLDGEKTWISNGGIAGHYVVFARSGEAPGARGLSAFVVEADTPGLAIAERIEVIAPHPLATLKFENCVVPDSHLLGQPGEGFKVAMATLDIFRPTVGAAALGFARRAMDEALHRAATRQMFGRPLADQQMTQAKLADMAVAIDTSALLVYRAAWTRDVQRRRITREAAMAKLHATETAQRVIDDAVQIFGGLGVKTGVKVEELYREIRALRIYEGATEVQKLIIARQMLAELRNQ